MKHEEAGLPAVRTAAAALAVPAGPSKALTGIIRAGDRVLQIGPGPAAVELAAWTGQPVTSVHETLADVQQVLAPLGPAGRNARTVDARVGDLFEGRPDAGPYDVIVVTAGIAGLSPRWLDQLAARGVIVAPVALGGLHPWVVAGRDVRDGLMYGCVLAVDPPGVGPQPAAGPLYAGVRTHRARHGEPLPQPEFAPQWAGVVPPQLTPEQYADLWLWLATKDDRTTAAEAEGTGWGPGCVLVSGSSAVHVRPQGLWVSGTDEVTKALAQVTGELVHTWGARRRPQHTEMTCRLSTSPEAGSAALVVPAGWAQGRPVTLPR
ncbi:protein-L-isoaspartate O-methyltransferase [Kitasatospora sp. NPDC058263]